MTIDQNTILLVVGILIIILLLINQNKKNKEIKNQIEIEKKKIEKEYHDLLFRYRNYEADGIEKYNETPEHKLNRIYNKLSYKNKQELINYAEILEKRERINQK